MIVKKALFIPLAFTILCLAACTNYDDAGETNTKLQGKWKSKDGAIALVVTGHTFTMNDAGKPVTEDYFIKGDTIFTSYQNSRPYTKWYISNLDDHKLTLFYPDSDVVEFTR